MKSYLEHVPGAMENLKKVGNWFSEELFTYIRVLGSYVTPHILPLYILDKFLCKEVAYQTIRHGITKALKDINKKVWPQFPLPFDIFSLANYSHAEKEL